MEIQFGKVYKRNVLDEKGIFLNKKILLGLLS